MKATLEQQAVIDNQSGIILVQAVPGSGKTATLVKRTAALPPHHTKLVLAFNKRAAEEFASRLGSVPGSDVRTFHGFCMREMFKRFREFGFARKPTLLSDTLLEQYKKVKGFTGFASWENLGLDEELISEADHSMYEEDVIQAMESADNSVEAYTYQSILEYRKWLTQTCGMTFDSMVRVVAENRHKLDYAARHVMVDEYQDVDRFQFDIAVALARLSSVESLAVVGDPNQRIYEWRGALYDAFGDFRRKLPQSTLLSLTNNFRSYDEIVAMGDTICPVGMKGVRGSSPGSVRPLPEDVTVSSLLSGMAFDEQAILCRYNRDVMRWQLELAQKAIPVQVLGNQNFWRMKHIKLIMDAWENDVGVGFLFSSHKWRKLIEMPSFQKRPERIQEVEEDAYWLLSLNDEQMKTLKECIQHPKGVKISTIHKTKGLEFPRVFLSGVTEALKRETFVYYVAVTRAKDELILC